MSKAAIIIISYNSFEDTLKPCIESIYHCKSNIDFETIIVDNGSNSGTLSCLRTLENHFKNLDIIYNPVNAGFASGNNIGIQSIRADYYILLNNDTVVTDHWLDKIVSFFEQHNDVGIVGPTTNYAGSEQRIYVAASEEVDIMREGLYWTKKCQGDYFYTNMLSFFCVVIKKEVIDSVGLLDEAFGVGLFEDTDYCLRAVQHNYKIVCLEDVFVYHKGSKSFNKLPSLNDIFYANLLKYEGKHHIVWESEHNKYLQLIQHYMRSAKPDRESFEKMIFKVVNKTRMLEQLNCSQLFRSYAAQVLMNMNSQANIRSAEELCSINGSKVWKVAKKLKIMIQKTGLWYPIHALIIIKRHGIKELIKRMVHKIKSAAWRLENALPASTTFERAARRVRQTYFFRSFAILKQNGLKELLRKIKHKLWSIAPILEASPYHQIKLLKDIDIKVIDTHYSTDDLKSSFSLVTTVKNECDNIVEFLKSIENQSLRPGDVVVVDGGSTDNTVDLIRSYINHSSLTIKLIRGFDLNIAQGRNKGVKNSLHDIIVFVDAGCKVDVNFCRNLIGPMNEDKTVDLVGGIYYPIQYSNSSKELIPDWSSEDMNWWKSFLPSARSQAVRKSNFYRCGGFPEYLTLTGEDTIFDINYRRFSNKWVYNKKAFVYWNAPMNQEHALKLWKSYGKGNGENGVGDFDFYPQMIEYKKNKLIQNETPMGSFFEGYIYGRENRSRIEISRRRIKGVLLVLAEKSFASLKTGDRLFRKCQKYIDDNYKIIYVYAKHIEQKKRYFNLDYSLIELYRYDHFDIDEFVNRYRDIFDSVIIVKDTDNADLGYIERKIVMLQKNGYYKLNSDEGIIATVFQDFPLTDRSKSKKEKQQQIIDHYSRWFPIEKKQGEFFAKLIVERIPDWLHRDILTNNLSILDFGCSCGHLVNVLSSRYALSRVCGIDIELVRINKAREYYPFNKFICQDIRKIHDQYDCIFTSNVLEHFEKPFDTINDLLLGHVNKYLVILVPYNEVNRIDGHYYTFTDQSFPMRFRNLNLEYSTIIKCNNDLWPGSQVLVVYSKK
jgi:GT2 family glycosyltransferase